nr:uncharacterized protein LOC114820368 [Malus domestica]
MDEPSEKLQNLKSLNSLPAAGGVAGAARNHRIAKTICFPLFRLAATHFELAVKAVLVWEKKLRTSFERKNGRLKWAECFAKITEKIMAVFFRFGEGVIKDIGSGNFEVARLVRKKEMKKLEFQRAGQTGPGPAGRAVLGAGRFQNYRIRGYPDRPVCVRLDGRDLISSLHPISTVGLSFQLSTLANFPVSRVPEASNLSSLRPQSLGFSKTLLPRLPLPESLSLSLSLESLSLSLPSTPTHSAHPTTLTALSRVATNIITPHHHLRRRNHHHHPITTVEDTATTNTKRLVQHQPRVEHW